jgi:hypothetical protein
LRFLGTGAAAALLIVFGPTLEQLWSMLVWGVQRCLSALHWLGARSAIEWGVAAMGSAFAFLALGAGISLRKDAPPIESGP